MRWAIDVEGKDTMADLLRVQVGAGGFHVVADVEAFGAPDLDRLRRGCIGAKFQGYFGILLGF